MKDSTDGCDPFPQTRWSLVLSSDDDGIRGELCQLYWRPIYGFLRRTGHSREDAEDLTQSFFAQLIKDNSFAAARKERGKLRSFLLGSLKRHAIDEYRSQNRVKRGHGVEHLPLASSDLDFDEAEHRFSFHPVENQAPDLIFDQAWLLDLLERTHKRIENDYQAAGKELEYSLLKEALATTREIDSQAAAKKLKVNVTTVRVLVHRLRQNFRGALRDEIAQTVNHRADIDEELTHLMTVFSPHD